jgi:hypothetical protein
VAASGPRIAGACQQQSKKARQLAMQCTTAPVHSVLALIHGQVEKWIPWAFAETQPPNLFFGKSLRKKSDTFQEFDNTISVLFFCTTLE